MPSWLPRQLGRIRELATERRVSFTLKARRELAGLGSGLDPEDACDVLARLEETEFHARLKSEGTAIGSTCSSRRSPRCCSTLKSRSGRTASWSPFMKKKDLKMTKAPKKASRRSPPRGGGRCLPAVRNDHGGATRRAQTARERRGCRGPVCTAH